MARWRFRRGQSEARRTRSIIAIACIVLMLIAVNVIAARYASVRFDLTDEQIYTLSRGTRLTLRNIDEPITLRFYYSARLGAAIPDYRAYARRVRELLDEYMAAAHGKLRLEIYQPLPLTQAEDRALAFGLHGVSLDPQSEPVYFGLAGTNSIDAQQVIPFLAPERKRFLEYDLTRLVHALAYPRRITVGLISGLPLDGNSSAGSSRPNAMLVELHQVFDIERLPAALDTVPASTDVLMLVHPRDLPNQTLFAIDRYVQRGGKAIVFVDPYSQLEARSGRKEGTPGSDLARLFKAWGIRLLPDTVVADRHSAPRVLVSGRPGGAKPTGYVARLNLRGDALNRDDPITANLRRMVLSTAGIIEPLAGAATSVAPLITASPASMKLPAENIADRPDVAGLLARLEPDDRRHVLAARVTGPVETAFPDGPPRETATQAKPDEPVAPPPGLRQSVQSADLVVVADTDLLDDRFWAHSKDVFGRQIVVPVANNADFVANAIEILAGEMPAGQVSASGPDLVDLRGRGISAGPFTLMEEIQRAAGDRYAAEQLKAILVFVNIPLVPIMVAAGGIAIGMLRLRRSRRRLV